jgi:hypothetical protein
MSYDKKYNLEFKIMRFTTVCTKCGSYIDALFKEDGTCVNTQALCKNGEHLLVLTTIEDIVCTAFDKTKL